jgi:MFS family permease
MLKGSLPSTESGGSGSPAVQAVVSEESRTTRVEVVPDSPTAWYFLALITVAYSLSYIDRQLLNLLVDPVKRSLLLTDVQISFLQGAAFVVAYCAAGPMIGRLVDIANRRNVLIACVALWSVATSLCGFASTFWELAGARALVGASEACIFPVAWSLIPELFSSKRGSRAYSIFAMGSNLGGAFSLLFGAAVVAAASTIIIAVPAFAGFEPWQMAFVLIGFPGLLFCLLLMTVREPARRAQSGSAGGGANYTFRRSLSIIRDRWQFYLPVYVANGLLAMVTLCIPAWFPTYLTRVFHVPQTEVGLYLGLVLLTCSTTGLLLGPVFARWLADRGFQDAPLRICAIAAVGMAIMSLLVPLAPTPTAAFVIVGLLVFSFAVATPLLGFACQLATPPQMRGLASSLYTFSAQLLGYAIGPLLIALTTDYVFRNPLMVGHSIQIVCTAASVLFGLLAVTTWKSYRALIAAAEVRDAIA